VLMEFMASRNPALIERQQQLKGDLQKKLAALGARGNQIGISGDLREIESLLQSYDKIYEDVSSQLLVLGGRSISGPGLREELSLAAEALERELRSLGDLTL